MPGPLSAPNGDRTVVSAPNPKDAAEAREELRRQGKLWTGKTDKTKK